MTSVQNPSRERRYAFWPTELLLDKEKLKAGYQDITKELNKEEKQQVEKKVQPWKEFLKADTRIKALAADIAKDYREVVEPTGGKAMVVTVDKEGCRLYYDERCAARIHQRCLSEEVCELGGSRALCDCPFPLRFRCRC
jgi:type I site-specific restriction-modification system R (restriction) subunit